MPAALPFNMSYRAVVAHAPTGPLVFFSEALHKQSLQDQVDQILVVQYSPLHWSVMRTAKGKTGQIPAVKRTPIVTTESKPHYHPHRELHYALSAVTFGPTTCIRAGSSEPPALIRCVHQMGSKVLRSIVSSTRSRCASARTALRAAVGLRPKRCL